MKAASAPAVWVQPLTLGCWGWCAGSPSTVSVKSVLGREAGAGRAPTFTTVTMPSLVTGSVRMLKCPEGSPLMTR